MAGLEIIDGKYLGSFLQLGGHYQAHILCSIAEGWLTIYSTKSLDNEIMTIVSDDTTAMERGNCLKRVDKCLA